MRLTATVVLTLSILMVSTAVSAESVGWRTDGTGKYPTATPPVRWSATENVVWKTAMPDWSNSTPILVAGKLFVCSEPTALVCLDAAKGTILWQKDNTYLDTLPKAEAARMKKLAQEIDLEGTSRKLRSAEGKLNRVKQRLKKRPNDPDLAAQQATHEKEVGELQRRLKPIEMLVMPSAHGVNGFSSMTPVSDGKHVYVLFGTGVAACYDLSGTRKWITLVQKPTAGYGQSSSPLLAGGKLIVHINSVFGLDKATGNVAWQSRSRQAWGTGAVTQVGGQDVVILPNGEWYRAADGEKLTGRLSRTAFNQPVVEGNTVTFVDGRGAAAYQINDGSPRRLWQAKIPKDRYYASPVVHAGLVYDITQKGVLIAIDARKGTIVYERRLKMGRQQCYPSITLAGKYLYASGTDGITVVFEPGRQFKEVARNTIEPFRSSPVFIGKRLYLRTLKHLYCIGK